MISAGFSGATGGNFAASSAGRSAGNAESSRTGLALSFFASSTTGPSFGWAKKIAGCALDTIDPEPLPNPHPLRERENVIINPHTAWYSEQAMVGLQAGAPGEVRRVLSGEWPINVVNRAVKGKSRAGL